MFPGVLSLWPVGRPGVHLHPPHPQQVLGELRHAAGLRVGPTGGWARGWVLPWSLPAEAPAVLSHTQWTGVAAGECVPQEVLADPPTCPCVRSFLSPGLNCPPNLSLSWFFTASPGAAWVPRAEPLPHPPQQQGGSSRPSATEVLKNPSPCQHSLVPRFPTTSGLQPLWQRVPRLIVARL